jgi:uncharacterized protein YecE (DUF72 family)
MMADGSSEDTNEVLIGMGGWELPPFNRVFYPAKPEEGFRKLEYFSRFFDLVEVNSTFYNTSLSAAQAHLVKLRTIFLEDQLLLDLRHISWNEDSFYQFCQENGFNLINVDLPRLPGHMPLNSLAWDGVAYFRMMGRNAEAWNHPHSSDRYLYRYSEEELHEPVQKIKQANARKAYVVFHNDRQAYSLVNGRQVEHVLYPTKRLTAPANLLVAFPHLKSFCDPSISKSDLFSNPQSQITD